MKKSPPYLPLAFSVHAKVLDFQAIFFSIVVSKDIIFLSYL